MKLSAIFILSLLIQCCTSVTDKETKRMKMNHAARINSIRVSIEPYFNRIPDSMKKWVPIFRNVLADDQKNRFGISYVPNKAEKDEQQKLDSQNLVIVSGFLDKYGWPRTEWIGMLGQRAIGMTIQHAPLETQKKYLSLLASTAKSDSSLLETMAMLEDRINVRNRNYQYYGTQVAVYKDKYVLYPVLNIDSLDSYRNKIKLKPIATYLKLLNINFDLAEYKKNLPLYVEEFGIENSSGIYFAR